MEKNIAENAEGAAARSFFVLDAEDRAIQLSLFRVLKGLNLFLALFPDDLPDIPGVFANAVQHAGALTAIFFRHDSP